jgi:AcrR family transcriptional regulator
VSKLKDEQIIKSAKKLISKYGFKKVSMDEIANDAGVTKKTVYSYFSSKEELLNIIIKEELNKMKKNLEKYEKETGDFFEGIHEGIFNLLKIRRKNDLFKILLEESEVFKNDKLKESLRMIEQDIMDYIKLKLIDANEKGYIDVKNIDVTTFLIYKMYIALMFEWNDSYKKLDEQEITDAILQILKSGIASK